MIPTTIWGGSGGLLSVSAMFVDLPQLHTLQHVTFPHCT